MDYLRFLVFLPEGVDGDRGEVGDATLSASLEAADSGAFRGETKPFGAACGVVGKAGVAVAGIDETGAGASVAGASVIERDGAG